MSETPSSADVGQSVQAASRPGRQVSAGPSGSLVAAALALLLLDLAAETFLAGSPIGWTVVGLAVVALLMLALLWKRLGPTARVAIPLSALVCLITWATIRLGSGADPALRMATLGLPRLALALATLALAASVALLFGLRIVRRAWYIGAVVAVVALYAIVPLVRALLAGSPLVQVMAGAFGWPRLAAWLQGGYLATEFLLPIGLLAGLAGIAVGLGKRARATWTTAGLIVVFGAFVIQSAELTRAGRAGMSGRVAGPVLAKLSKVAAPDAGLTAAGSSPVADQGGSAPVGSAPAPAEAGAVQPSSAPPALRDGMVAVAHPGQPIVNKAIELRVTSHRSAPSVGGQTAGAGQEFVIVDTAWKNLVPKVAVNRKKATDRTAGAGSLGFGGGATARDQAEDAANTTIESVKFEVGSLPNHLWLLVDGRIAEAIDVVATRGLEGHLGPNQISIDNFHQVVSGGIAFRAPAGAQALSLLFLDSINGHLLVPITGAPPVLASSLGGGSRANEFVDLAVTGATWADAGVAGSRRLVVGLKGISRKEALVDIPFGQYGFLQTERGCLVSPDAGAPGLSRPLAPKGRFIPFVPSEGQLAFTVPADTKGAALLLRTQQGGPIDLPVLGGAKPSWPAPDSTITDGDVLRVLRLPGLGVPPGLPPAPAGSERVALDLVVENLRAGSGIELQAGQQFRLVGPAGAPIEPSAASASAPCRLDGAAVVPAAGSRRFTLVYDVPPGAPLQLEYRGFNVPSERVKVR